MICGLTDVTTGIGFSRVTALLPCTVGVFTSAACTVTTLLVGTVAGAVYWPVVLIKPVAVLPPTVPFTDQLSAVSEAPVTVAVNCKAGSPGLTFDAGGFSTTLACGVVVVDSLCVDPPPQPMIIPNNEKTRMYLMQRPTDSPFTQPMVRTLAVNNPPTERKLRHPGQSIGAQPSKGLLKESSAKSTRLG